MRSVPQSDSIATWLSGVVARCPYRKVFTMPIWVIHAPCGCMRERPLACEGLGAYELFLNTRWQVKLQDDGSMLHLECGRLMFQPRLQESVSSREVL